MSVKSHVANATRGAERTKNGVLSRTRATPPARRSHLPAKSIRIPEPPQRIQPLNPLLGDEYPTRRFTTGAVRASYSTTLHLTFARDLIRGGDDHRDLVRPSVGGGAPSCTASRVRDGGDRTDGISAAHISGADEAPTSKSTRFAIGCADAGGGGRCTGSCSSKVLRSTDVGGGCTTEWRWRCPTFAERPWEGMRERNRQFASQLTELACERIAGPLAVSTFSQLGSSLGLVPWLR